MQPSTNVPPALDRPGRVLIEAPQGYRKSARLEALTAGEPASHSARSLDEAERLIDPHGQSLLVVGDVAGWSQDDQSSLGSLFAATPAARFVVMARACDPRLLDSLVLAGTKMVTIDDLRVTNETVGKAIREAATVSDKHLQHLIELIDGWPMLATRVSGHLKRSAGSEALTMSAAHPVVSEVVDTVFSEVSAEDRQLAEQLAHLPSFTPSVANALSGGLLGRLRVAGVPIERVDEQQFRFIRPVLRSLEARSRLDPERAESMAGALASTGLHGQAAQLLIRIGRAREAAALLSDLSLGQIDASRPTNLLSTLDLLAGLDAEFPRLLLVRAYALGTLARLSEQFDCVTKAIRVATDTGDAALVVEARVERAFLQALRHEDSQQILSEIDGLVASTVGDIRLSTRLIETRSLLLARSDQPDDLDQALDLSRRAVESWVALGEYTRAAIALRLKAMSTLMPIGRHVDADAAVDQALYLSPGATPDRLRSLVVSCLIIARQGDDDSERLSEAAMLASGLGLEWAEAYVYWARALLDGVHRDADGVWNHFSQAWQLLGELQQHSTGTIVLCEISEALSRSGDLDRAGELLRKAHERRAECEIEFSFAELSLAARDGRADFDDVADRCDALVAGRPALGWRTPMLRGVAAAIREDPSAGLWFDRAEALSTFSGPLVVDRLERSWYQAVIERSKEQTSVGLTGAVGGRRALDAETKQRWGPDGVQISVLGKFEISKDGRRIRLPGTRVNDLIKVLAMGRGRVNVEVLCDRLWPDVLESVARRRLRNVLLRARQSLGDAIVREHDTLQLGDGAVLDLAEFSTAARIGNHALATDDPAALALALQALALYTGPLLPDDLYDDNVASVRLLVTSRAKSIVDAVMSRGTDDVLAPVLFEAMLRIDPDDLARFSSMQEWAVARGHAGVAASAAAQVEVISIELGYVDSGPSMATGR